MKVNRDKFFKSDIEISPDIEDDMYEQLQRNVAKALDIDFAKTPLVDLLTGYKRYVILQQRIDKAIEYLKSYNTDFKNCRFGEAPISIRELGDLLEILGDKENE